MLAAFFLLLAVGPLLMMSLPAPRTVTDVLPRAISLPVFLPLLIGVILALLTGRKTGSEIVHNVQTGLVLLTAAATIATFVLLFQKRAFEARLLMFATAGLGLLAGVHVLHDAMVSYGTGTRPAPKALAMALQLLAAALVAVSAGGVPVLLVAISQGWSKATARLTPTWLAATLLQLAIAITTLTLVPARRYFTDHPVSLPLHLILLIALPTPLLLATRRFPGRRTPLLSHRVLLLLWPGGLLAGYLALRLLYLTSLPL